MATFLYQLSFFLVRSTEELLEYIILSSSNFCGCHSSCAPSAAASQHVSGPFPHAAGCMKQNLPLMLWCLFLHACSQHLTVDIGSTLSWLSRMGIVMMKHTVGAKRRACVDKGVVDFGGGILVVRSQHIPFFHPYLVYPATKPRSIMPTNPQNTPVAKVSRPGPCFVS